MSHCSMLADVHQLKKIQMLLFQGKKVPIHQVNNVQISSVIQMHAVSLGFYLNVIDLMRGKKHSYSSDYAFSYINRSYLYIV